MPHREDNTRQLLAQVSKLAQTSANQRMASSGFLELDSEGESPSPPLILDVGRGRNKRASSPKKRADVSAIKSSKPNISRVGPSDLMQRLSAFLPRMREANQRLATADPRLYNIELEDADADADADAGESEGESESKGALPSGRVIEMTFGLGLCDEDQEEERPNVLTNAAVGLPSLRLPGDAVCEGRKRPVSLEDPDPSE